MTESTGHFDRSTRRRILEGMALVGAATLAPSGALARQDGRSAWRQQEALTIVKDHVRAHYVFPDRREALIAAIESAERSGRLNGATATAFADALTGVMREAVHDKHLSLTYAPEWVASFGAPDTGPTTQDFDRESVRDHYGIASLEHITGNIRYVRITGFGWVADRTGQAYDDLMRFLKEGDAVIIDIRGNSGGDHSAVRYLVSHFLDPDTKLYDFQSTREPAWSSYALGNLPAGRLRGVPTYVLIDNRTVSAGEDLAYQFQQYRLGELVGTQTSGAANNNEYFPVVGLYRLSLSVGRPIHPVSGTNWEGVGIEPTLPTPAHEALDRALIAVADKLAASPTASRIARAEYEWTRQNAQARLTPVRYSERELRAVTGAYEEYVVTMRDGSLWLQSGGGDPLRLRPMAERSLFALEGRDYTRARFGAQVLELLPLGAPEPRRFRRR